MDRTPIGSRLSAVDRVRAAASALGLEEIRVVEFPEGTATAADAAAAIGTTIGHIVKSLVFMARYKPVLVLASGPNRVDVQKIGALLGQPIGRANADQVREATSYAIGGVPPFGHPTQLQTYFDEDLLQYDEVWAAAGTPNSVFPINPHDLLRITNAQLADVAVRQ